MASTATIIVDRYGRRHRNYRKSHDYELSRILSTYLSRVNGKRYDNDTEAFKAIVEMFHFADEARKNGKYGKEFMYVKEAYKILYINLSHFVYDEQFLSTVINVTKDVRKTFLNVNAKRYFEEHFGDVCVGEFIMLLKAVETFCQF